MEEIWERKRKNLYKRKVGKKKKRREGGTGMGEKERKQGGRR